MNRQGHEGVEFFIGPEVEHTPAFSKRTLFVVGKPKLDQIERMAREYKTPHVFMGANHSFNSASQDPYWDTVITALLDRGFWVTLDYQAHEHETVLTMLNPGVWQSRHFVPLLGVRIPRVQTSNVNLTVKIDDVDFAATNAGVWCLHHRELTDSNRFTDWQDYGTDEVIGNEAPVPMPPYVAPPVAPAEKIDISKLTTKIEPVIPGSNRTFDTEAEKKPTEELNQQQLGLDLEPKKPISEEAPVTENSTPADAAEAYAGSAEPAKKKGKK